MCPSLALDERELLTLDKFYLLVGSNVTDFNHIYEISEYIYNIESETRPRSIDTQT